MTSCKKCGAEIADEAKICRECGALQTGSKTNGQASGGDFFSMPYLSSVPQPKSQAVTEKKEESKENNLSAAEEKKKEKIRIDQITDPRERAFAKQDRRNKMIRIAVLILVIVVIAAGGLYLLLRSTGYQRALDLYIEGKSSSAGSKYAEIVPETYLIDAEKAYDMSRPDIRSKVTGYMEYVEEQMKADYGDDVKFSYKIISESSTDDKTAADTLEETILSAYDTEVSITEVAYVSIRLTTAGSITQTTETKSLTFFECDGRWCCLDAMQITQFACENAGYQLW